MKMLIAAAAALCLIAGSAAAQTQYSFRPNSLAIDTGVKVATAGGWCGDAEQGLRRPSPPRLFRRLRRARIR